MPRRPRIKLAGIPQHIVQRGINREACFFAEEDYHCYLHWLMKSAADWRCTIHAYVLMTNHVHLLVTPETADGPARLMQSIGRRYVQYINRSTVGWGEARTPTFCGDGNYVGVASPPQPTIWETECVIAGRKGASVDYFLSALNDAVASPARRLPRKNCAKRTATEIAPLKE